MGPASLTMTWAVGRVLPHLFTLLVLDSGEVSLSDEAMNTLVWVLHYGCSAYRKSIEKRKLA